MKQKKMKPKVRRVLKRIAAKWKPTPAQQRIRDRAEALKREQSSIEAPDKEAKKNRARQVHINNAHRPESREAILSGIATAHLLNDADLPNQACDLLLFLGEILLSWRYGIQSGKSYNAELGPFVHLVKLRSGLSLDQKEFLQLQEFFAGKLDYDEMLYEVHRMADLLPVATGTDLSHLIPATGARLIG
jgi:hypothetical protein